MNAIKPSDFVSCRIFPCLDVRHAGYLVPDIAFQPERVRLVLISESAPENAEDYYYAHGEPSFQVTTLQAFQDAGAEVTSFQDILDLGVYLTTAVKCAKTGYGIQTATIKECSLLLEEELGLFPNVQAYLLMGDVAIQAVNTIARRAGEPRVVPAGSTYKLRGGSFYFREARVYPSYLQVGPSFGIEKSKRKMIAEDIRQALTLLG